MWKRFWSRNSKKDIAGEDVAKAELKSLLNESDPNFRIFDYLDYYVGMKSAPSFAVLLKGPWGVGKSHLIERLRNALKEKGIKCLYVSLNGKASIEDVDLALWSAAVPALDSRYSKVAGRVGQAALSLGSINIDLSPSDFPKAQADVYIFDDLERCQLPIEESLGYINQFIEHEKKKVIIVANEKELLGEEYVRKKEKVVGMSLEVKPSLRQAYDYYVSDVVNIDAKAILSRNFDSISEIYTKSEIPNLRILRQTIDDFIRIVDALREAQYMQADAMADLVRLFFAFSLEYRAGRIDASDIRSRSQIRWKAKDEAGESPHIDQMRERYSMDIFLNTILSDEILVEILENGFVSREGVAECVAASPIFAPKGAESSWRVLWHWMEQTEQDFKLALRKLDENIADCIPMRAGEILHAFGIRLWMSDSGLIRKDRLEVIAEAKRYIAALYDRGELELLTEDERRDPFWSGGWQGLSFFEAESAEFRELREFLVEKQRERESSLYPMWASKLLEEMSADSELFFRRLNYSSDRPEDSRYSTVPVLVGMNSKKFVAELFALDGRNQMNVCRALDARHGSGRLITILPEERAWLERVAEELQRLVDLADGIDRIRKERVMNWICKPVL